MKIALVTQREGLDRYGAAVNCLESAYIKFAHELGYEPVAVPNDSSVPEGLLQLGDDCLLILTGGGSLPTSFYRDDYGYDRQPKRDRTEERLFKAALAANIPVLAICRGMQFCCGLYGGTVTRLDTVGLTRAMGEDHEIQWGERTVIVNHYHGDGVLQEDLPVCFKPIAYDVEKGNVEAFLLPGKRFIAIQWHPERPFRDVAGKEFTRELIYSTLQIGE